MTRERRVLAAVAAGRVTMTCGCAPELRIDGLCCCDQSIGPSLTTRGWIQPDRPSSLGAPVPAVLTDAGRAALADKRGER